MNVISALASHFILSGAISNFPPLFPTSILDTYQPGGVIFWYHIFFPFHTVHGVLATILVWFAIPSSHGPRLSELSTMTHPSWVDLHGMAHSFIELDKVLCQDGRVEGHALIFSCECLGVSGGGVDQGWPAAGLGAWSVAVHAWDLLREVTIIFITSTIV